jgi:hypothetical protein
MTTSTSTFYGVRNGELTTNSKNCKRAAVLAAVEADGFVYGVAAADGTLEVINRSKELAEKWLADRNDFYRLQTKYAERDGRSYKWTVESEDLQVVKVYPGKATAEEAASKEATVAPATVELTDEQKAKAKEFAAGQRLVTLDRRLAAAISLGNEADIAFLRYAIRVAECSEARTITPGIHRPGITERIV